MSVTLIKTNLNGGELTPMLEGRIDVNKYGTGLRICENFVPTVQGPITSRAGTRFVAQLKDSSKRAWLVPFVFSAEDSWILEFGDQYIRFYTNRGQVQSGGSPYEISSPYELADLTNPDGTFAIGFAQSADVVYLVHADYEPAKLSRTGTTNWTLTSVGFTNGPFDDPNTDDTKTVYASATTGTGITITASSAIFTADHVGTMFYIEGHPSVSYIPWEVAKAINANDERRSDGKIYKAANSGTTGSVKPTHSTGQRSDGGISWDYLHANWGIAKITAIGGGGTTATADVVSVIPSSAVGSSNATSKWAFYAWRDDNGYPEHVTFFRERLCFARRNRIWMSVAGDYENFSERDADTVTADMAIDITLVSNTVNNVKWMAPAGGLIVGSTGSEFMVTEITTSDPLGPDNVKAEPQGEFGSRGARALRIGESVLFAQRAGRKVREIKYSFESDAYVSVDVSILADHITKSGIVSWAYAQEPDAIVWAARADGTLLAFTFNREQDVIGWSRQPLGGTNVVVESVAVVPSPDASRDDVWLIVRRTIDGETKRYVEYITERYETGDDVADCMYMDCGATYSGVPATTIIGLEHLEGETVVVLADGATHPDRVVTGGTITLQRPASKVQVGLRYEPVMQTMRIEGGSAAGTAQGKTKRINEITVRFLDTINALVGPYANKLDRMQFRSGSDPMDSAPPLFTGDKKVPWPAGYDTDGRIMIKQDQPLPITIVAVIPQLNVPGG